MSKHFLNICVHGSMMNTVERANIFLLSPKGNNLDMILLTAS